MTLNKPNDLEAGSTHGHSDAGKRGTPDIRVDPGTPLDRSTEALESPASGQSHRCMSGLVPPSENGARRLRQPASAAVADSETSSEKPATSRHVPDGENAVSLRRKPSIAFTATSGLAPQTFRDLAVLYQVVAERRTSFDNLLWQCPSLALTAQSFLFSIALDSETTRLSRIISMVLSLSITLLSLHLFTRQLCAEAADHEWLIDFEKRHGVEYEDTAFGDNWRRRRFRKHPAAGPLGWLAMHRAFPLWATGLMIFAVAAVLVLLVSIFKLELLQSAEGKRAGGS